VGKEINFKFNSKATFFPVIDLTDILDIVNNFELRRRRLGLSHLYLARRKEEYSMLVLNKVLVSWYCSSKQEMTLTL
jgi:hypothetical protein